MSSVRSRSSRAVDRVIEVVRARVADGTFSTGEFIPTEMEMVTLTGVSRGTVRTAIDRLVESGELTRRPHSRPIVANLVKNIDTIGSEIHVWISQTMSVPGTLALVKGLSEGFRRSKYQMVVREPVYSPGDYVKVGERRFMIDLLSNPSVAGAIWQHDPFFEDKSLARQIAELGKPLVFIDSQPISGVTADFVGTDNTSAARKCVRHLIELGHRQIVCAIDSLEPIPLQQRLEGYWRAMRIAGIESYGQCFVADRLQGMPDDAKDKDHAPGHLDWYGLLSRRIVREMLQMETFPTAIFAGCDYLATSLSEVLRRQGIRTPEDISIVGFDHLSRWDPLLGFLTTASQNFEGFGHHAADLMLDRLDGKSSNLCRQVLLEAPLVVLSSTANPSDQS